MRFTISRRKPLYCEFVIKELRANVPMNITGATDDLTTLVEQLMSFEITSKHIR